jgi:hypothetical protein
MPAAQAGGPGDLTPSPLRRRPARFASLETLPGWVGVPGFSMAAWSAFNRRPAAP